MNHSQLLRLGPQMVARARALSASELGDLTRQVAREANCTTASPELFYPTSHSEVFTAAPRAICAACPVENRCLLMALARGDQFGILGGTTPEERDNLIRSGGQRIVATSTRCSHCDTVAALSSDGVNPVDHRHPKWGIPCPGGALIARQEVSV